MLDRALSQLERQIEADPLNGLLVERYLRLLERSGWEYETDFEIAAENNDWPSLLWIINKNIDNPGAVERVNRAVLHFGRIKSPATIMPLINLLNKVKDLDANVYSTTITYIVWALGSIGYPEAIPSLSELSKRSHPNSEMAVIIIKTLGKIGDPEGVPIIGKILSNIEIDGSDLFGLAKARDAVIVLGEIGDLEGIPYIVYAVKNLGVDKKTALKALSNIGVSFKTAWRVYKEWRNK